VCAFVTPNKKITYLLTYNEPHRRGGNVLCPVKMGEMSEGVSEGKCPGNMSRGNVCFMFLAYSDL